MTPAGLSKNPTKKPLASLGYWRQGSLWEASRGGGGGGGVGVPWDTLVTSLISHFTGTAIGLLRESLPTTRPLGCSKGSPVRQEWKGHSTLLNSKTTRKLL